MNDSSGALTPIGHRARQLWSSVDPIEALVSGFEAISVVALGPTTETLVAPMGPHTTPACVDGQ